MFDLLKTFCHKTQKFNTIKVSHDREVPVKKFKSMVSPAVFQGLYQLAQCYKDGEINCLRKRSCHAEGQGVLYQTGNDLARVN